MKPEPVIFQLIATLSQAEKRHFRIFASRHVIGEENSYLDLFDAIIAFQGQGIDLFLQAHASARFAKNIHYNLHYLYHMLLRSLQAFAYEGTATRKLMSMADKVEILFERQLFVHADKLNRKLIMEAEQRQAFPILIQALQSRRKIILKLRITEIETELQELHLKFLNALTSIQEEANITYVYDEMFLLTRKRGSLSNADDFQAMDAILSKPILQIGSQLTTFWGRIAYQYIYAFADTLQGHHSRAEEHYNKIVQIWKEHPVQIKDNQERFAMAVVDLLSCWHKLDQYDRFELAIASIRNLDQLPKQVALRVNWITSNLEVLYYLNTLRLDTAQQVVQAWEQVLKENIDKVSEASILSYSFNIALLYFIREDFSTSLKWINRILNHPRTLIRSDVQRFARTFYLILQIELGNLDLLELELASARRALKQQDLNPLEEATFTFLQKLIHRPKGEWPKHYKLFQSQLAALQSSGTTYFGLQELQIWIDSRRTHKPMSQTMTKQ